MSDALRAAAACVAAAAAGRQGQLGAPLQPTYYAGCRKMMLQ